MRRSRGWRQPFAGFIWQALHHFVRPDLARHQPFDSLSKFALIVRATCEFIAHLVLRSVAPLATSGPEESEHKTSIVRRIVAIDIMALNQVNETLMVVRCRMML